MPWNNENDLRRRLAETLPQVPNSCPDPQCGDSTWDHECQLGGSRPDTKLVDTVAALVQAWLLNESAAWRQSCKVIEAMDPFSVAVLSLRTGADALTALAMTVGLPQGEPNDR